jgi:hypothetical protein
MRRRRVMAQIVARSPPDQRVRQTGVPFGWSFEAESVSIVRASLQPTTATMTPRAKTKNGALSRDNRLPQYVCIDRLFTEIIVHSFGRPGNDAKLDYRHEAQDKSGPKKASSPKNDGTANSTDYILKRIRKANNCERSD